MTWMQDMDHSGMGGNSDAKDSEAMRMTPYPDGRMPGTATEANMECLRTLSGKPAEVLFS